MFQKVKSKPAVPVMLTVCAAAGLGAYHYAAPKPAAEYVAIPEPKILDLKVVCKDRIFLEGAQVMEISIFSVAPPATPPNSGRENGAERSIYFSHTPLSIAYPSYNLRGATTLVYSSPSYRERVRQLVIHQYERMGVKVDPNMIVIEPPKVVSGDFYSQPQNLSQTSLGLPAGWFGRAQIAGNPGGDSVQVFLSEAHGPAKFLSVEFVFGIRGHAELNTRKIAELLGNVVSELATGQKFNNLDELGKFVATNRSAIEAMAKSRVSAVLVMHEFFISEELPLINNFLANLGPLVAGDTLSASNTAVLSDIMANLRPENRAGVLAEGAQNAGTDSTTGANSETSGSTSSHQSSSSSTKETSNSFGVTAKAEAEGGAKLFGWGAKFTASSETNYSRSWGSRLSTGTIDSATSHGEKAVTESTTRALNRLRGTSVANSETVEVKGDSLGHAAAHGKRREMAAEVLAPIVWFDGQKKAELFMNKELSVNFGSVSDLAQRFLSRCAQVESALEVLNFICLQLADAGLESDSQIKTDLLEIYRVLDEHRVPNDLKNLSEMQAVKILESNNSLRNWKSRYDLEPERAQEFALAGLVEFVESDFKNLVSQVEDAARLIDRSDLSGPLEGRGIDQRQLLREARIVGFIAGAVKKLKGQVSNTGR